MSFSQWCPQLAQKIEDMVLVETFIYIFLLLSKETQLRKHDTHMRSLWYHTSIYCTRFSMHVLSVSVD